MGSPPYSLKEETAREILELEVEFLPEADYLKRLCYGDWELRKHARLNNIMGPELR
ncbi:LOW QUALITY PROTEIN: hypothetical protein YC2023_013314 [Brassica napus]